MGHYKGRDNRKARARRRRRNDNAIWRGWIRRDCSGEGLRYAIALLQRREQLERVILRVFAEWAAVAAPRLLHTAEITFHWDDAATTAQLSPP